MGNAVSQPSQIILLLVGAILPQWPQHLKERPCLVARFIEEAFAPGFEAIWLSVDII